MQILTDIKGEIENNEIIVEDFNASLAAAAAAKSLQSCPPLLYLETWRLKHETLEEILTIPQSPPHHHSTSQRS